MTLDAAQVDRACGVLLASAAGDALGAGYEFSTVPPGLEPSMIGGGLGGFAPGEWTDDTAQAVAIARVSATGADLRTAEALDAVAQGFAAWFADDPADVGIQTAQVLGDAGRHPTCERMARAARAVHEQNGRSAGNGSLMRTGPVALAHLDDPDALVEAAMAVSGLTHHESIAREACALWCLMIRHAVLTGELPTFDDVAPWAPRPDHWREVLRKAEEAPPSAFTHNAWSVGALQAAWSAITHTPVPDDTPSRHLQDALTTAIRIGHDTDTVAAIAGALLGARWGMSAVPASWRRILHGWPDIDSRELERLAVLASHHGATVTYGWPLVDHIDYLPQQYGPTPLVRHPHDDGVWLAGAPTLDDLPDDVDAVVSLCLVGRRQVPDDVEHLTFRLVDEVDAVSNPNLDAVLLDAAQTIATLRDEGKVVLLHCVAAYSRTPTVAAAYAMLRGVPAQRALNDVLRALPHADPHPAFRAALDRSSPRADAPAVTGTSYAAAMSQVPMGQGATGSTWAGVFPWLTRTVEPAEWGSEEIAAATEPERRQRVSTVADVLSSRARELTFGQAFPGVPDGLYLRDLDLPNRALNQLDSRGYRDVAALANLHVYELVDWPRIGAGTVGAILRSLVEAALDTSPSSGAPSEPADDVEEDEAPTPWQSELEADLRVIAAWRASLGRRSDAAVGSIDATPMPARIADAAGRIRSLAVDDVLRDHPTPTIDELLDEAMATIGDRSRDVLRHRTFAPKAVTLDELGGRYGVTRERVRQLESKALELLQARIAEPGPLQDAASTVAEAIRGVRPFTDLLWEFPALSRLVPAVSEPAWRVLDVVDDDYEIRDGWCAKPSVAAAVQATTIALEDLADTHGVLSIDLADVVALAGPGAREATYRWLDHCGYVVHREHVVLRWKNIADYAAAILDIDGSPLSTGEIKGRFIHDRSQSSIKNALSKDARFHRSDRDTWALAEWGLSSYTGIRDKIHELLADAGGAVPLAEVVETIAGSFSVSTQSVIAYAAAPPFTTRDGDVMPADAAPQGRSPHRTRALYRRDDAWIYRTRVTGDHYRGSGSPAPSAIVRILGMTFGEERRLASADGEQSVYWTGLQPGFGTIRRLLDGAGLSVGDEVFLVLGDDAVFSLERVGDVSGGGVEGALALIGRRGADDSLAALALAVGHDPTTPVAELAGVYRDRGESDIADVVDGMTAAASSS